MEPHIGHDAIGVALLLLMFLSLPQVEGIWEVATATWYGSPDGAGTDGESQSTHLQSLLQNHFVHPGGACGYGQLPGTPYGLFVSAGSPPLFKNGRGCGECYMLKCFEQKLCSSSPVTVTITDECPGGYCSGSNVHFDLSGSAFGKLASSGMGSQLLASGVIKILYQRVACDYHQGIMFQVNQGSSPFWFSVLVRYEDGAGDLRMVEIKQTGPGLWQPMNQIWGANWCLNSAAPLQPPFSFRVTTLSGQALVAFNVIPQNWAPNMTYGSTINFPTSGNLDGTYYSHATSWSPHNRLLIALVPVYSVLQLTKLRLN